MSRGCPPLLEVTKRAILTAARAWRRARIVKEKWQ
jgi:hypothetical protein